MRGARWPRWLMLLVFFGFVLAAGFFTFSLGKNFALTSPFEGLGQFNLDNTTPEPGDGSEPVVTPPPGSNANPTEGSPQLPQAWMGAERVTILIMGLDYRDWEAGEGAPRTDTMILLTLDPISQTAGMLSIPRDLYVPIPGFDYDRINTAYRLGETYQLPGGGPQLALDTVEQLLGVGIDFYAQVDFTAFVRMIDEIGGLKVDVKEPIEVDPIGPGNHKFLEPGVQTLPGDVALAYARARNSEGGDFDRAQRQQQVILAIRDRILSFDLIPILLAKSGLLYTELSEGVRTNMSLEQGIQLGLLGARIPEENILRGIIGSDHIVFYTTIDGDQVLKPRPDKIREVRDYVFGSTNPGSPLAAMTPEMRVAAENPTIRLLNASFINGLAGSTGEYINSLGVISIADEYIGNSDEKNTFTRLIDYTGNPNTIQWLVEIFGIQPHLVKMEFAPDSEIDIELLLGDDWSSRLPSP